MKTRIALLLLATLLLPGEIIDRIAITIGSRVIPESEIFQAIRLAAFIDGREPDFSLASKRKAAETVISQVLLIQEMDETRFTVPSMADVIAQWNELIKPRYPTDEAYQAELAKRRITDEEVRLYLQSMIRAVEFIDLRFTRGQQVSSDEIAAYYSKEFREYWQKTNPGKPVPPLEEVSPDIEEWILGAKTDTASEEWLQQTRARSRIRYREEVFQ
ncbi:MAG: hypothetical protein JST93_11750 [Acidobacteria bacterium]|nr:hypothetical protein [Acidobacteriota bacterium]